jgi:hypothetical protein
MPVDYYEGELGVDSFGGGTVHGLHTGSASMYPMCHGMAGECK